MMTINPLGDKVYIKPDKKEEKVGNIWLHQEAEAKKHTNKGIIISIGPDVKEVKKDQRVLFGEFSGTLIEMDGEEFLMMPEDEIQCIIE